MPFNEKSRLDPSQVQDRRGMGTGTKLAVGGGGLSLLVLLFALLMGVNPGDLMNTGSSIIRTDYWRDQRSGNRMPDGGRCEHPPGLRHRGLRQQHSSLLV